MAFGDGVNDIPMFRASGKAVAVMNASDDVKKAADLITGPYGEDGPADFIEKNIL